MKDMLDILRRNFVSPTVIAIFFLAVVLAFLNERRDALFISSVILFNTMIAVIQEIRARKALKKLELMNAPRARRVVSGGRIDEVMLDELKIDDVIRLEVGDEIPADGTIINSNGLEVNESILTGESASIDKNASEIVYAASLVVAGNATMKVTAIGQNTRAGSMTATLKRYRPSLTPLQRDIFKAINWLTYGAMLLALLICIMYFLIGRDSISIVKTITSAAVSIIPEGLLLASSLLLAFGSVRLAAAKVLPQKLSAIEAMALLNVLCVDKTGTLTSDKITFEKLELFDDSVDNINELIAIANTETDTGSSTAKAMSSAFSAPKKYDIKQTLAFSSERKMSGVKVEYNDKTSSVIIGAPEFIADLTDISKDEQKNIESLAAVGKRVILVAVFDADIDLNDIPNGSGHAAGIIILSNKLRGGVKETINFMQDSGVSIKVISGDNPSTVRYIAENAGIANSDRALTGKDLEKIDEKDWTDMINHTAIFARVLPEQKEKLISSFRRLGKFTGMIGDGVNDALALKKADLSVAMYSGAPATRRVADIVILNNSFNSLPIGMKLGNRIMQAIELIATLFFHKIIYGVVLLLSTFVFGLAYPFQPRHITFMNIFLVTLPTLMWTFFTPYPNHRLSPKYFWRDTLMAVAPIAILSGIIASITYKMLNVLHPNNPEGVSTTTVIIAIFFGIYLVFLVPRMFDVKKNEKTVAANIIYVAVVSFVLAASFGFGLIRDFFDFTAPAWQDTLPLLIIIITTAFLQRQVADIAGKRLKNRSRSMD